MKKKISLAKHFVALALAMVTLVGIGTIGMPVKASAASNSVSGSITSIKVNSSGFYVVTKKTALRSNTRKLYSSHATLEKGALVQGVGCSPDGKFIMVNASNKTWWVKLSDLKKANETTNGSIYYCTKSVTLRNGPYEKSSKVATLSKGSLFAVVGQVRNSYSHTWLVVDRGNGKGLAYLYLSSNVKSAKKVTMMVSGENTISVGDGTLNLKCTVNPSAITGVSWSSSNTKVATVSGGKVTPKLAGSCTITAKIGNTIEVRFPITVTYKWPTTGKVTSEFGERYIFGSRSFHGGIDIGANEGTNIKVVADGKVTYAGWHDSYGNLVIVRHADGSKTYYAHCSKLLVSKNQNVTAGQVIAKVGSTGRSTGNHLHFEIRINGNRVNPRKYLE